MTTDSRQNWRAVGDFLRERRSELGYRQRTTWVRDHERPRFGLRVIIDLETGVRDTYGDDTLTIAEDAYRLRRGSLRRALDTGEPPAALPIDDDQGAGGPTETEAVDAVRVLDTPVGRITAEITQDLDDADDLTPEERAEIEAMLAAQVRASYTALIQAKRALKDKDA